MDGEQAWSNPRLQVIPRSSFTDWKPARASSGQRDKWARTYSWAQLSRELMHQSTLAVGCQLLGLIASCAVSNKICKQRLNRRSPSLRDGLDYCAVNAPVHAWSSAMRLIIELNLIWSRLIEKKNEKIVQGNMEEKHRRKSHITGTCSQTA